MLHLPLYHSLQSKSNQSKTSAWWQWWTWPEAVIDWSVVIWLVDVTWCTQVHFCKHLLWVKYDFSPNAFVNWMPASMYAVFLKSPKSVCSPGCWDRKLMSLVSSEKFHWSAACGVLPDGEQGGEPWLLPLVLLLCVCIVGEAKAVIVTITQWSHCYTALYSWSLWCKKTCTKKDILLLTRLLHMWIWLAIIHAVVNKHLTTILSLYAINLYWNLWWHSTSYCHIAKLMSDSSHYQYMLFTLDHNMAKSSKKQQSKE